MATSSMGIGMQLAVQDELRRLMGLPGFPGYQAVPFTKEAAQKIKRHPYHAMNIPSGARGLLALLTVHGRSIAVTISQRMTVTRAELPSLPQSLFKGSVFDGYLQRSADSIQFLISDCLAFKGLSVAHLTLHQRLAGVTGFTNDTTCSGIFPSLLHIGACARVDMHALPRSGTWLFCPEMLGFGPGKVQPDTYVACLDDVKALLADDTCAASVDD